ncbi:hypothetical protein AZ28_3695 [Bordetella pertussis B200]|nr:hypothetical protein AZ28_3695 [Bordetella pertussis B200]
MQETGGRGREAGAHGTRSVGCHKGIGARPLGGLRHLHKRSGETCAGHGCWRAVLIR